MGGNRIYGKGLVYRVASKSEFRFVPDILASNIM